MRTILRKTSTKQLAGYGLLTLLTLLFMGGFMPQDHSLHDTVRALVRTGWAVLGMIGFAFLLQKGFAWAMNE